MAIHSRTDDRLTLTSVSLCSGVGMLDVGAEVAFDSIGVRHRTLVYCERDAYAAACLRARMVESCLEPAAICDDLGDITRESVGAIDAVVAGFPCFVAGTLVLTEAGYRPIETLAVGDHVLTHAGRWRPVTAIFSRDGARVRRIKAGGVPGVVTTDEHPFYARLRGHRNQGGKSRVRTWSEPAWTKAAELTPSHFVSQVLPDTRPDRHSLAFWRLVGRYLADGWQVDRKPRGAGHRNRSHPAGRIVICANKNEAPQVAREIADAGFRATQSVERTVIKFHITKTSLHRFLQPFGRLAHGKTLPGFVFELEQQKARALLDGYISGDGYTCKRWGDKKVTTVSKQLAMGVALLAQRAYGVVANIRCCRMPDRTTIEGRSVNQRDFWIVSIPHRNRSAFVDGHYGWKRVSSVECIKEPSKVWNIAVEQDESYIAEGAVVHNCQPWSTAGKGEGTADARWIWPDIFRIVQDLGAWLVILENVPGLRSGRGLNLVLRDLAEGGFHAEWLHLTASAVGASHKRERVFIVAWRECAGWARLRKHVRNLANAQRDAGRAEQQHSPRKRKRKGPPEESVSR